MAKLERLYTIPLRKDWLKTPKYRRSKKSISVIRTFISKHMKNPTVKIGSMLNEEILKQGKRNPPHKVRVKAIRYDDPSFVRVDLPEAKFEEPVKEKDKKAKEKVEEVEEKAEEKEKKEVLEHAKLTKQKQHLGARDMPSKKVSSQDEYRQSIGETGKK